jgi:N-acetylglucosamine-6-sulfatase
MFAMILIAAGANSVYSVEQQTSARQAKPNVIVVMTDDQALESLRAMPRTRRLIGGAGVTFANNYISYPLCCPSRATFLTGQYAHNNGVARNGRPLGGYRNLAEAKALPVWMQRAGYATSHIGKYPNGWGQHGEPIPPGWDVWKGSVDPSTYLMWGYELNENGWLDRYGNAKLQNPDKYQTDVYLDKALDFIDRRAPSAQPFFLSMAFLAPHAEASKAWPKDIPRPWKRNGKGRALPKIEPGPRPAPRHNGAFADEPLPTPPSFDERDISDKPKHIRNYPRLGEADVRQITSGYRQRLASLLAVDEAVEALVDRLAQNGELDNTYLIFTSDNGFFFGEHRVPMGKFLPYDAASHTPLLIRGPGIPAGRTSEELVTNTDLAATLADIADARPTVRIDGRSLLPFAAHPDERTRRPVLHEGGGGAVIGNEKDGPWLRVSADLSGKAAAAGDLNQDLMRAARKTRIEPGPGRIRNLAYEGIRTERYLYVRYLGGDRELYDLRRDPYELHSRHDDPAYAKVRDFLDERLDELQGCKGAACNREIPKPPPVDRSRGR